MPVTELLTSPPSFCGAGPFFRGDGATRRAALMRDRLLTWTQPEASAARGSITCEGSALDKETLKTSAEPEAGALGEERHSKRTHPVVS